MKTRKLGLAKLIFIFISILILIGDIFLGIVLCNRIQKILLVNIQESALNVANCAAAAVDAEKVLDIYNNEEENAE